MTLAIPIPLAFGRFKQLPQRSGEVWQGGLVRLPMWIDQAADAGGAPYRPAGAVWVSSRTGLVHLDIPQESGTATPEFALGALFEFGLKMARRLEGRPARVEVRDPALRDALADQLGRLSTAIEVVERMPNVDEVLRSLEAQAAGGERIPGLLEMPGITVDRLRAFTDAASLFYAAGPWKHLANEDLIVVEGKDIPKGLRHVAVLGHGGEQFGLSFFDSRRAFERLIERHSLSRAHGVTFGAIDELPFGDVDAWSDHALPLAGPRAYPLAADFGNDGSVRRPDGRELTTTEALLRALAGTTEAELDTGRWQKRVTSFDGEVELTFTLPYLIEGEANVAASLSPGSRMHGMAERSSVRIARAIEGLSFESSDDLNGQLQRPANSGLFDLSAEEAVGRELTALERAQELAYDAMEAEGRLRVKRARQALAASADCADAWAILAHNAATPEDALASYERAVTAGVRAIGAERFEALTGEFWGHLETRPYMRARLGLADALDALGRSDEAVGHYREMLRLNPSDNQGVRYLLLATLLDLDRDDEAGALLEAYRGDPQALWPYARVLLLFRTEGDSPAARAALSEARRINPHVVKYLVEPDTLPPVPAPHFAFGSKDEAAYAAEALGAAYAATPDAAAWLQSRARKGRR